MTGTTILKSYSTSLMGYNQRSQILDGTHPALSFWCLTQILLSKTYTQGGRLQLITEEVYFSLHWDHERLLRS